MIKHREGTTDEKVIEEIFEKKAYRKPSIGFDVEPLDVWLDLGAQIGCFSVWAADRGAKHIYAYEPEPSNFALLKVNTKELPATAFNKAVCLKDGKTNFYLAPNTWRHSMERNYKKEQEKIQIDCLDVRKLIANEEINAVKMDIEGAEIEILESVDNWHKVRKLVFEYSFTKAKDMKRFFRIAEKLRNHFQIVSYPPSYHKLTEWKGYVDAVIFCIGRKEKHK